jgi:phosphoserine phosphatase RsbU/P
MPKLILQSGPRTGQEFSFDTSVVLGRGKTADVSLDDPDVSRRHALLRVHDGTGVIVDLTSGNGTFVNGRRVTAPTRLRDGDVLALGSVLAAYKEDTPARSSTPVQPIRWVEGAEAQPQVELTIPAEGASAIPERGLEARDVTAALAARLRFLDDLARTSSEAFDQGRLLAFVVEELLALIPQTDRAFVALWDEATQKLVPTAVRTRSGQPGEIAASRTLLDEVVRGRQAVLALDIDTDARYSRAESILGLGIRSVICAPMIVGGEVHGVIQVDSLSRERRFGKGDLALLVAIAAQVGAALAYARAHASLVERELLERDLDLARRVQRHFLPLKPPAVAGYGFAVEYRPAVSVGGDFYDFLNLAEGVVGIAVGDVSGKGVSAALYGAKVLSDLRYQAVGETDPAVILGRLNRALTQADRESMFVTLALAVLHAGTNRLILSSAGHLPPLVRDAGGRISLLGAGRVGNLALGVTEDATYDLACYEADPGDAFVLYTDGVTEAMNGARELFGDERLMQAAASAPRTAEAMTAAIVSEVDRFSAGVAQSDDITVLTVCRNL